MVVRCIVVFHQLNLWLSFIMGVFLELARWRIIRQRYPRRTNKKRRLVARRSESSLTRNTWAPNPWNLIPTKLWVPTERDIDGEQNPNPAPRGDAFVEGGDVQIIVKLQLTYFMNTFLPENFVNHSIAWVISSPLVGSYFNGGHKRMSRNSCARQWRQRSLSCTTTTNPPITGLLPAKRMST